MRKTSRNERLSTTVNPRFDLMAPRKEYENCEKRIDQIKRDTQKNFDLNKPHPTQSSPTSDGGINRQTETLKQLKFLYETAVALVADAERTSRTNPKQSRCEEQGVDVEDNDSKRPQRPSRTSQARNFAELRTARFGPNETSSSLGADDGSRTSLATGSRQPERHVSMVTPEFVGPPSQAVQLISMIRVLTLGEPLKAKQMKALTAVLEESRIAVKAVKGNSDPDRAQERLIKRLTELLELVRPQGAELTIRPEEILNCSYLRLTKDNIQRLEAMLREQGFEPGIHCHSDVKETPLTDLTKRPSTSNQLAPLPQKEKGPRETMSVYMTKAGTPLEKKRIGRPDSVAGPSDDDDNLRMKKFRAT